MSQSDEPLISVLVADDEEDQRVLIEQLLQHAEGARHVVTTVADGRSALTALREQLFDVALLDLSMPGLDGLEVLEAVAGDPSRPQVVFVSGRGTVETATRAMKLGAFDFLEKPVDRDRLITVVWKAARAQRVFSRTERLEAVVTRDAGGVRIVTEDQQVKDLLQLVARIAPSDVSVLIVGESGTGKELIARELHRLSGRHAEPLVALNCAAVAESLAESELFGHEKGAFTGAISRKMGLIELSHGGTLFLDEVGDLELSLQAKLLRVLESKVFRRVGGVKELPTNFRLVSATNRPLQRLVDEGAFRGDLFYRINAIVLELPPLRDRPGDISVLALHFLAEVRPSDAEDWTIAADAVAMLENYSWPGNARELRNVIERAALLCHGTTIRATDLGSSLLDPEAGSGEEAPAAAQLPSLNLERLEAVAIERALERTGWHQGRASELLGVSDRTLHRKIKGLGLRRPD
ncbi:MAG: sigma-54-dependent Fis family transcriptional regulator [Gemmatimonadetes bacterium]|nr:sigma-54-dependent Fis family transcriptional regulator [Gemmatimonadota bacterium]